MPKYGGSSDYTLAPTELDPLKFTPNFGDTAGAAFREASQYTVGRQAIDRSWMEAQWSPIGATEEQKQFLSIDEANQKYGLKLKPTYAKRISVGLAEYFQRKQLQSQMDQAVMQQSPADPITGFGAGVAASFTDPAELLFNTVLLEGAPLTRLAKSAQLSAEAGEFVRPSVAARFFARFPSKTVLNNPMVSGAVEGAGSVALMSPLTYFNSQALGRKYTLEEALTSIAAAGTIGAGMGGVHGLLTRGLSKVRPVVADHGAPIDPLTAHMTAEVDMNNGRPVDVGRSVDVAQRTKDLADARAEIEQTILRTQEHVSSELDLSGMPAFNLPEDGAVATKRNSAKLLGTTQMVDKTGRKITLEVRTSPDPGSMPYEVDLPESFQVFALNENGNIIGKVEFLKDKNLGQLVPEGLEVDPNFRRAGIATKMYELASSHSDIAIGKRVQTPKGKSFRDAFSQHVLEPVEITNPEAARHTTPLEQKLLAVTNPEGFKAELQSHLSDLNLKIAKLGELLHLPEAGRLEAHEDITLLQNEILGTFSNLNEILPTTEKGLPTEVKTTNKGLITKKSLQTIGKEVARLNDLAVRDLNEPARLATLQAEHTRLSTELKKAMSQLKQGQAKGWATVADWQKKVGELTPQLEHAARLLQAHGVDVQTPELSLSHYVDSLGENLPPALQQFIESNPGKLQEPLYRVRNNIFDAIRSRMDQTQKYLQDLDYLQPVRQFPEDDEILRELNKFMNTEGQTTLDPAAIHEEAAKVVDQQISEYKSLGIFDEKNVERFDHIKKQFDEQLQKTDAVKKGSLQAQVCALGGVTEDE